MAPMDPIATDDSTIAVFNYHGGYIWIPSGKLLQFAIENGPVEIVDLPIENGDFP